jgi:hypothetical protein
MHRFKAGDRALEREVDSSEVEILGGPWVSGRDCKVAVYAVRNTPGYVYTLREDALEPVGPKVGEVWVNAQDREIEATIRAVDEDGVYYRANRRDRSSWPGSVTLSSFLLNFNRKDG